MSKRVILWMELISFVLAIIGLVVFLPAVFSTVQTCTQEQIQANTCTPTVGATQAAGFGIGVILFIIAGVLATIAWIGALIRTARMQDWIWFIIVLLLHGLGTLIYAFAGPSDRPVMAAGYPPQYPPQYPQQ